MSAPMWMKNLTVFRITKPMSLTQDALDDALALHRFTPCSAQEREQHGFTPAFEQETLSRQSEPGVFWVELTSEHKVVPGAAVKRLLAERIQKIEEEEQRKVSKKEKKELKELLIDELLATALTTRSRTLAVLDLVKGYVILNTSSSKKADLVASMLINCLPDLNLNRPEVADSVATAMADLLVSEDEQVFRTDSSLLLKGPGSPAASVRFAKHSLQTPEVLAHLKAGLRPAAMELTYNDRLNFTLTDPFAIKGLSFHDIVTEDVEAGSEDASVLLDSTLTIQTAELRDLLADVFSWLGVPEAV